MPVRMRDEIDALVLPDAVYFCREIPPREQALHVLAAEIDDRSRVIVREQLEKIAAQRDGKEAVGIDEALTRTMGTGREEKVQNVPARALAREHAHAHVAHGHDAALGTIGRKRLGKRGVDRGAVCFLRHVDEVHGNQSADVAQAHLPRDLPDGDEVGLEHRLLQAVLAREFPCVDVDDRHRLGTVDDQIAAVLHGRRARTERAQLGGQPVLAEGVFLLGAVCDPAFADVRPEAGKHDDFIVQLPIAYIQSGNAVAEAVAHDTERKIELTVNGVPHLRGLRRLTDRSPDPLQILRLDAQMPLVRRCRRRTHDKSRALFAKLVRVL